MSEITKEELMAMIDVQGKTATSMENIANSLRLQTETSKEILACQKEQLKACADGRGICSKSICEAISKVVLIPEENKKMLLSMEKDMRWVKIITGAISFITISVLALLKFSQWLGTLKP